MTTISVRPSIPDDLLAHWKPVSALLRLRTESDYRRVTTLIDRLVDLVGDDRRHPLYELLDTLGTLTHAYEEEHYPMPDGTPAEALSTLMRDHDLSQRDLPEIGSQGVVSEVLRGKRSLNVRQIAALAERFAVSPMVFFDGAVGESKSTFSIGRSSLARTR
jgi:HTH-type transcriptional regulator/antitoxin HigA